MFSSAGRKKESHTPELSLVLTVKILNKKIMKSFWVESSSLAKLIKLDFILENLVENLVRRKCVRVSVCD